MAAQGMAREGLLAVGHFEPVGDRARWLVVYDLLTATETNGVVTYESMATALALDPSVDRQLIQATMRRAAKQHLTVDNRAVLAVPNRGYRVVEAAEHLRLARRQQVRSTRALRRGHSVATHVDMSKVEPETRKALDMVASVIALQMDFNRRAETKLAAHDRAIKALTDAKERTDEERQEFRERLERLEAAL